MPWRIPRPPMIHKMYKPLPTLPYSGALSLVPAPILSRLVPRLTRSMRRRHPRLVAAFSKLDPAVIHIEPHSMRHRFAIAFGGGRMGLSLLPVGDRSRADAIIRGNLTTLIDLLEGRIDGDSMFFARDIEITGDTAVAVAVRNTLDREEIVLRDEIAAMFGPMERPVRRIARRFKRMTDGTRTRIGALHTGLHAAEAPPRDIGAECDALRADVAVLRTQLAKFDVRQLRANAAAGGAA